VRSRGSGVSRGVYRRTVLPTPDLPSVLKHIRCVRASDPVEVAEVIICEHHAVLVEFHCEGVVGLLLQIHGFVQLVHHAGFFHLQLPKQVLVRLLLLQLCLLLLIVVTLQLLYEQTLTFCPLVNKSLLFQFNSFSLLFLFPSNTCFLFLNLLLQFNLCFQLSLSPFLNSNFGIFFHLHFPHSILLLQFLDLFEYVVLIRLLLLAHLLQFLLAGCSFIFGGVEFCFHLFKALHPLLGHLLLLLQRIYPVLQHLYLVDGFFDFLVDGEHFAAVLHEPFLLSSLQLGNGSSVLDPAPSLLPALHLHAPYLWCEARLVLLGGLQDRLFLLWSYFFDFLFDFFLVGREVPHWRGAFQSLLSGKEHNICLGIVHRNL